MMRLKLTVLSCLLVAVTLAGPSATAPAEAQDGITITDLGTLGGSSSVAWDVGNLSQLVGFSRTATGATHAFLWTAGGDMEDLGTLGGPYSDARGVSDLGHVVGETRQRLFAAPSHAGRDPMVGANDLAPEKNAELALAGRNGLLGCPGDIKCLVEEERVAHNGWVFATGSRVKRGWCVLPPGSPVHIT